MGGRRLGEACCLPAKPGGLSSGARPRSQPPVSTPGADAGHTLLGLALGATLSPPQEEDPPPACPPPVPVLHGRVPGAPASHHLSLPLSCNAHPGSILSSRWSPPFVLRESNRFRARFQPCLLLSLLLETMSPKACLSVCLFIYLGREMAAGHFPAPSKAALPPACCGPGQAPPHLGPQFPLM